MSQSYSVRESKRAKYVSLKISSVGCLEVVVPLGFDQSNIPAILAKKQDWIDRVQQKLAVRQSQLDPSVNGPFPAQIPLEALGQTWNVEYRPSQGSSAKLVVHPHHQLRILGNVEDWNLCQSLLKRWFIQYAKQQLVPLLAQISDETGLGYRGVSVRSPKTRWGSCSAQHKINLNSKLIFLRPEIVRYVLIHELCHTVHFDHSPAFWSLVGCHEPYYQQLKQELKVGHYLVPHWME